MAGMSLKALAADPSVAGVKKTDMFLVAPQMLCEEDGFNLRDYEDPEVIEHIEGFAKSYGNGDYVPPLLVRVGDDGRVMVVEGHCRRRGALLAVSRGVELAFVQCLRFLGNDTERTEVMLRSAEGLKLKPLAVALGYKRLRRLGHSNASIAKAMNKTGSHVEQMLILALADHDVHDLVRRGLVAASVAIDAVREHREKAGAFLTRKVNEAQGRGKVAVTRGAVAGWRPPPKVVTTVFGTVEAVVAKLDRATKRQLAEMEKMDDSELKGKKIEVDAGALLELVKAHGAVVEAKAAKEKSDAAAKEAASQQALDIDEPVPEKATGAGPRGKRAAQGAAGRA